MISSVSFPDPISDSNDVSDVTYRPYLQQNVIISWLYKDFKGLFRVKPRKVSHVSHVTVSCSGFKVWKFVLKPISYDNISESNFFANNQSMTHFYVLTCIDLRKINKKWFHLQSLSVNWIVRSELLTDLS